MFSIFVYLPITLVLLISTYTDLKKRLIYNWITYPSLLFFLVYHLLINYRNITTYLLGFLILGGLSLLIALISNGLGGGDIKLFALIGVAFGWEVGLMIYVFSYISASLIGLPILILKKMIPILRGSKELPMAPFIAIGTLFTYLSVYVST